VTSSGADTSIQSRALSAAHSSSGAQHSLLDPTDFVRLFDVMPHPYLIVRADPCFTIVAVNGRYLEATGTGRSDIIGRGLFEVFPENPGDPSVNSVSDLRASLQRVLRDRVVDVMGVQKYDVPARDGSTDFRVKYWSPINTPVAGLDGSITFIIHHVEDVTDFVLQHGRPEDTSVHHSKKVEQLEERVQAEVMRRASDLKEANRQIKAREAQLARLNDQLQHLDKLKTEFFSNVSHEFRTPLTVILGPLESLLREQPQQLPAGIRTSLEMMYRNALRLLKLVNTLLEFSRIEAHRAAPHWQSVELSLLTRGIASTFQSLCEQAHLRLEIDCPRAPQTVSMDPDIWERILLNLLSNAFKFTFSGRIEVRLDYSAETVELTVRDTGTGIPQAELPRLFERFHRIRGARGRTYEGTGIGLALVKELVELLRGSIAATSTEGEGSCFVVRIPLEQPETASLNGPTPVVSRETFMPESSTARGFVEEAKRWLPGAAEIATDANVAASPSPHILVADDNADMRGYISRLLREAGYEVKTAANGAEAQAACKTERPALVLADVMMPVMSGTQLAEQLRADPQTSDLPIILISARSIEEVSAKGALNGADDYIMKPFHVRELIARVNTQLQREMERKRAETQLRQAAAVFTGTNEAVIITDSQRRTVAVNDAFTRITGFTSEDVMGRDPKIQSSGRHDPSFYQNLWHELDHAGYWQGEIWNRRKSGELYPAWENISAIKDACGRITHYVAVFSDIGSIKATEERLEHIAHHDALTGLPNRLLFTARLEQSIAHALRGKRMVGLLMLDLDRFKLINDTLGHAVGDLLLQKVAERLQHCVRAEDTVARLGGDEFAIVLNELTHRQDAALVADKIIEAFSAPILLEGQEVLTSASLGISLYPDDAASVHDLLKAADAAMYRAKQKGHHGFEAFHSGSE